MIDFNDGIIIQMNLNQKLELEQMLQTAIENRERIVERQNAQLYEGGPIQAMSFQNQLSQSNDAQILKMRESHYQKKAAIREQ